MTEKRGAAAPKDRKIAYFSMEIGLQADMPTYSGGLGILAGDTIRTAADMEVPMIAVTLLPRQGYFRQELDPYGRQIERPDKWQVARHLKKLRPHVTVSIEGRTVKVRAWQYDAVGVTGGIVPVLFLDTDMPGNDRRDRHLSQHLYGGDSHYRLCQEYVLGVGGVRMLRALGHQGVNRFHLNEGHAAFLILELLDEELGPAKTRRIKAADVQSVRRKCVFTTHTPVAAGHDKFSMDIVRKVIGRHRIWQLQKDLCDRLGTLNMTYLALRFSHYINGVSKQHGQTSQEMFNSYRIDAITNGVHAATWTSPPFQQLLDRRIPAWRRDNFSLRYALSLSDKEIWDAHTRCKTALMKYLANDHGVRLDPKAFTVGFARRATAYKRAALVLQNIDRLKKIAATAGAFQIIFAGKAHPKDQEGKELICRIFHAREQLEPTVRVVYLPNYDIALAGRLIPGVDLWLNTPEPPHEASGTSGMKAALNAVPSLSILDGWWTEGCVEDLTGWAVQASHKPAGKPRKNSVAGDARVLYNKLEKTVIPTFYHDRARYIQIMRAALALNGSFFNTQRMLQEYLLKAYF